VEVGEDHGVELDVVESLAQLPEDAVPAVQQDVRLPSLDQIAAAGPPGVLPRGRLAEHRDSQEVSLIACPAGTLEERGGLAAG
jgi:hypothetical protein